MTTITEELEKVHKKVDDAFLGDEEDFHFERLQVQPLSVVAAPEEAEEDDSEGSVLDRLHRLSRLRA